jgi:hypothetical protein
MSVMSRREQVLSAGVVFLVALAVRAWAAALIDFPTPEDTAYYVGVARTVVEHGVGDGLVSNALWSYQTPPLTFPRPAFEVWLPLPSFLAAIPMLVLGTTFDAAQWAAVVVGAIVPVLAWRLAADVALERGLAPGRSRTLAVGTGVTTAVYLPLVLHSALPDSTILFAALALGACMLMPRIARDPRAARPGNPMLIALGVLLGVAALTRNEVIWVALTWAILAWRMVGTTLRERLLLIGIPALVAALVFSPWAIRNLVVFDTVLPSQTLTNALSITGFDIFAWNDRPTLDRYLAVGGERLIGMRVEGLGHNLFNVLLLLGIPVAPLGLLALPWHGRDRAVRPVVLMSVLAFLVTSLVFPVATTWGTYLHAAGPAHVLLVLSCLLALDAAIARVGAWRGWTRPVAWLGPALGIFGSALFCLVFVPAYGRDAEVAEAQYAAIERRFQELGQPLAQGGPVITNFPIWLADATGARALALPAESPPDVLDLARHFPGTTRLIVIGDEHEEWPDVLDRPGPGVECFEELDLRAPAGHPDSAALAGVRAFRLVCP